MLLHHAFGEVNGRAGVWGHAIGGMGAITQAMARAAGEHGVRIDLGKPVREVIVERAAPAASCSMTVRLCARAPSLPTSIRRLCCRRWCRGHAVPPSAAARMKRWKAGSGSFRMNVALSRLPDISALPEEGDHLTSGIILAPSLAYMDRAYRDCLRDGFSREPIVEMVIPSTLDDSLAPSGAHVASLFCQHVAPDFCTGAAADERREKLADLMIDTVEAYAPGFAASVIARAEPVASGSAAPIRPA